MPTSDDVQSLKSRRGPKPLPKGKLRRNGFQVYLTDEEMAWARAQADGEDRPLASWARRLILRGFKPHPKQG